MDYSAITCDEIIESYDDNTNFNEKKVTWKMQNFCILLAFLLALLIADIIFFYLIKYRAKQKKLLPFHFKNSEL